MDIFFLFFSFLMGLFYTPVHNAALCQASLSNGERIIAFEQRKDAYLATIQMQGQPQKQMLCRFNERGNSCSCNAT